MTAAIKNADIPRVGAGTPGGTWFRRYWLPVSRSDEIFDIPKREVIPVLKLSCGSGFTMQMATLIKIT